MPELPEVETIMRGLDQHIHNARFVKVETSGKALRFAMRPDFAAVLEDRQVTRLTRRAKYILAQLDGDLMLVMHMGMSGRLLTEPDHGTARPLDHPHDHVRFSMDNGITVTYRDPRRFGFMDVIDSRDWQAHKWFRTLGIEPLSDRFDAGYLARKAHQRQSGIKAFLLDQRQIAGLGNIYVCEALHQAGLSPFRKTHCLATVRACPTRHAIRLVPAIKDVLRRAIEAGGSSLKDFQHTDGSAGYFQHDFAVYGRTGAPCPTPGCDGVIAVARQNGRSSFYCPACQPRPAGAGDHY